MKRRFESEKDGAYWEVGVQGSWLTTSTGPVGASGGQADSEMFRTVEEVLAEASRRIEDKLSSGYVERAEPSAGSFDASLLWRLVAERSESPLPNLVGSPEDELAAWRAFGEKADLSDWAERLIFTELCNPGTTSLAKLIATMTRNPHGTALVCAGFSNLEFLCGWDDDDECTFLVDRTATQGGYHRVYGFEARLLELDDKSWSSITSFVWRDRENTEMLPSLAPLYLDPLTLSRRSTWLTCALAGVGMGSLEEDTKNVADVASFSEEAPFLAEHAHLACYWLLHHYIAGNTKMLEAALERSAGSSHPWVAELRGLIERAGSNSPLKLGAISDDYLETFAKNAPARAFARGSSTSKLPTRVKH